MNKQKIFTYGGVLSFLLAACVLFIPTPLAPPGMFLQKPIAMLCAIPTAFGTVLFAAYAKRAYALHEKNLFVFTKPILLMTLLLWMFTPVFSLFGLPVTCGIATVFLLLSGVTGYFLLGLATLSVFYFGAAVIIGALSDWDQRLGSALFFASPAIAAPYTCSEMPM